jgi:hypothetical protein
MMSQRKYGRPNCAEILIEKNIWSLSLDDLKSNIDSKIIDKILKTKLSIDDCFHEYFIQKKLKLKGFSKN